MTKFGVMMQVVMTYVHGKGGEFGLNENGGDETPGTAGVPGSVGVAGGVP